MSESLPGSLSRIEINASASYYELLALLNEQFNCIDSEALIDTDLENDTGILEYILTLEGLAYPYEASDTRWRAGYLAFHLAYSVNSLTGTRPVNLGHAIARYQRSLEGLGHSELIEVMQRDAYEFLGNNEALEDILFMYHKDIDPTGESAAFVQVVYGLACIHIEDALSIDASSV